MPKSTTAKTPAKKVSNLKPVQINKPLQQLVEKVTEKKVKTGGLDPNAVLKANPEKTPRAEHNISRQKILDGKTVKEALESRIVDSRDLNYDISKGFLLI